jgi:predicted kinase
MTLTVYALCGLPFAGKSTVAGALARRSGAPVIRLDAINHERGLGLDGSAISWDEWERTYDEAYRRIDRALADGRSVIFDHGNFNRSERDRVREIAKRRQARVVTIYVPVAPDEARRRWLRNRETGERYDVRDEDFELALRMFEPPDAEADVVPLNNLGLEPLV